MPVYDTQEDKLTRELAERRALRRRRQQQRRRRLLAQRALFLLGLVLIAAMVVVLARNADTPRDADAAHDAGGQEAAQTADSGKEADGGKEAEPAYRELFSPRDADGDGVDDYHDIMLGARAYIATDPVYDPDGYFAGGYPDNGTGVCTDVIWQAFRAAGYDLKALVDADIAAHPENYPELEESDPNIDFRRVSVLDPFFTAHAEVLSCALDDPDQWQAGDIVVFGERDHIAICSDKRRPVDGIPYIIHHGTLEEGPVEVDAMNRHPVTGHYRWNGMA